MINILLEAYIAESKLQIKRKIDWVYLIIAIIATSISIILLLLYCSKNNTALVIIAFLFLIALYIDGVLWEKQSIKKYQLKFKEYNKRLDIIKKLLIELKYNHKNWYSSEKIQYLIESGELIVEKYKSTNARLLDLGKTFLFPIISFVAGAISSNAKLSEIFLIAFVISFLLTILVFFTKLLSLIVDLAFKSSSIKEIEKLVQLLKDLHSRDIS